MMWVSRIAMAWFGVVLLCCGCRTRERIPDYLPREVVANQVGNAVVYQINDPRAREVRAATPQPVPAPVVVPGPVSQVSPPLVSGGPSSTSPVVTLTETPRIDGTTPRQTLYGQPEGVAVSGMGLREVTLTWKTPTDEVYRYRIERAEAPDGPYVKIEDVAPKKLSYKDTGARTLPLKDNTAYYYRLIALLLSLIHISEPTRPY